MNPKTLDQLYFNLSKCLPDARSELVYRNHFELLVSVILSAQSTDKVVNSITKDLFARYPDAKSFLKCGARKLESIIKPIGLAPSKARNIIGTCEIIIKKHRGQVPDTREELEKLPGVGRKTANVVLNEGFSKPTIAVDTHVFRVANRTGLAPGNTVLRVELKLLEVTPKKWLKKAHRYLILHGRYTCKAKNYMCGQCPILNQCQYSKKIFSNTAG